MEKFLENKSMIFISRHFCYICQVLSGIKRSFNLVFPNRKSMFRKLIY